MQFTHHPGHGPSSSILSQQIAAGPRTAAPIAAVASVSATAQLHCRVTALELPRLGVRSPGRGSNLESCTRPRCCGVSPPPRGSDLPGRGLVWSAQCSVPEVASVSRPTVGALDHVFGDVGQRLGSTATRTGAVIAASPPDPGSPPRERTACPRAGSAGVQRHPRGRQRAEAGASPLAGRGGRHATRSPLPAAPVHRSRSKVPVSPPKAASTCPELRAVEPEEALMAPPPQAFESGTPNAHDSLDQYVAQAITQSAVKAPCLEY